MPSMKPSKSSAITLLILLSTVFVLLPLRAVAFSFSEAEEADRQERQAQSDRGRAAIKKNLDTPCPPSAREKRIMLLVSERQTERSRFHGHYQPDARQARLFGSVNDAFRKLGFRTYTQQQITDQIAQAEYEAVANGDVDAAIEAASRLGADYVLKATIGSRAGDNPVMRVKEVVVEMSFEIQAANGEHVGSTSVRSESFSGQDTTTVAQAMARENAPAVASRLYRDLCTYETRHQGAP